MLFQIRILTALLLGVTLTKSNHFLFANSSRFTRQVSNGLGCLLPYSPPNGDIQILGSEQEIYVPNTLVQQQVIINLSCKKGYLTETGGLARAICLKNTWLPAISKLGGCAQTCPPLSLGTYVLNVTCTRNNLSINCERPIEGTRAEVVCKPSLEFSAARPYTTCQDGSWDYQTLCQPECGRKQIDLRFSSSKNEERSNTEFPWAALIYKAEYYFCSATIISRRHVLSIAHAFTNIDGILRGVDPYIVAVGKVYYNLKDLRDSNTQTSKVAQIFVPKDYKGRQQNYVLDLAVLTLETPLVFNEYVQPVCIDWDNRYESEDLKEDSKGHIVAWGPPNEHIYLQNQTVLYKASSSCSLAAPTEFISKYLTRDKFCGLVVNDAKLCGRMAGAGFVFQNTNSKFYVRGVLSVGYWLSCSTQHVEIYTKVSMHLEDIANATGRV